MRSKRNRLVRARKPVEQATTLVTALEGFVVALTRLVQKVAVLYAALTTLVWVIRASL
jgi:hypothetical protein